MLVKRQTDFGQAWLVGEDDNFYLAWGRSLVVDRDWDFENDVAHLASLTSLAQTSAKFKTWLYVRARTDLGRIPNKYAVGAGLLALPMLAAVRLVLEMLALAGVTGPPNPFSPLYVFAFITSGVIWGFVGLVATRALLRREAAAAAAPLAIVIGALGLPLGYYIWVEPTMAHATGFGLATLHVLCVRAWADRVAAAPRDHETVWKPWAFLAGLTLGVACLVRFTNVVLAVVPVVVAWSARPSSSSGRCFTSSVMIQSAALAALGAAIGFLPQLIAWKAVYGTFVVTSYGNERLAVWPAYLFSVLFGARNSLFLWTPLALAAVIGLGWGVRRSPMCRAGLIVVIATAWIYGSWGEYWLGASFGMRGFVDVSFFLILGLAEVIERARSLPVVHPLRRAGGVLVVLSLAWTLHLIVCHRANIQPAGEPLAPRRLVTEWRLWSRQLYNDTGLKTLVHRFRPG